MIVMALDALSRIHISMHSMQRRTASITKRAVHSIQICLHSRTLCQGPERISTTQNRRSLYTIRTRHPKNNYNTRPSTLAMLARSLSIRSIHDDGGEISSEPSLSPQPTDQKEMARTTVLSPQPFYTRHPTCPSCGHVCFRPIVFQKHIQRCCPDLLDQEDVLFSEPEVHQWTEEASRQEVDKQQHALVVAFRQVDSDGNHLRQGPEEISVALNVTIDRAKRLLKSALKAVPLAADCEPIEVIFEDDDFIALNKPAGIITAPKHRYTGGSLVNRIIGTRGFEPGVLHRLDMNTSGVVLFAKTRDIVPAVHQQFREKSARKRYLALVAGSVQKSKEWAVDAPIGRHDVEKVARSVHGPDGKPAQTKFTCIQTALDVDIASLGTPAICSAKEDELMPKTGASLIECEPLTGRTHQIRVHLAHCGLPILGDDLYGFCGPWLNRQALHARELIITHPRTGKELKIEAPLPSDFQHAMKMVGLFST